MATTTIHQGQDLVLTVTVYEDDALTTPKDITGVTIVYRLGHKATDTTALQVTGTPNSNGSVTAITDAANGVMTVTLDAADLQLPAQTYDQQVRITDQAGNLDIVYDDTIEIIESLP